jgi:hypothetical protein
MRVFYAIWVFHSSNYVYLRKTLSACEQQGAIKTDAPLCRRSLFGKAVRRCVTSTSGALVTQRMYTITLRDLETPDRPQHSPLTTINSTPTGGQP